MQAFTLVYHGSIKSGGKSGKAKDKHEMRMKFSDQIRKQWKRHTLLNWYLSQGLPEAEHYGRFCQAAKDNPFFFVSKFGFKQIVPLVTSHNGLLCELDIFLRMMEPKLLAQESDLDNRIKIVFDALRMPHAEQDVPDDMRGSGFSSELYCLFDDDRLIRRFSVRAEDPNDSPPTEQLDITVKITRGDMVHSDLHGL